MPPISIEFACVGELREVYCLLPSGEARLRELGGSAVYAAVGARLWTEAVGLVARVGNNYPADWLPALQAQHIDTRGVKIMPEPIDARAFYAYLSPQERVATDPAAHFERAGRPLPPELADYAPAPDEADPHHRFSPLTARPSDAPRSYLHARGFHLTPASAAAHTAWPVTLRRGGVHYITCAPSQHYMQPVLADSLKLILHDLDAFLPSESETRAFFRDHTDDLWQAAEAFGAMGAKVVVIKLGAGGQYVYAAESKRKWHVPAYPAKARDITGAGDAYGGGFLAGLTQTQDPLEAALRGAVSASLVIEGSGALYALGSTPGLAGARLQALREMVRAI